MYVHFLVTRYRKTIVLNVASDCLGVCTLCWVAPNTGIVAFLCIECCFMFVFNGMSCTDRGPGPTSALLLHLWDRFWIPQRDAMEMGKNQGAGLDRAVCRASTCWHARRNSLRTMTMWASKKQTPLSHEIFSEWTTGQPRPKRKPPASPRAWNETTDADLTCVYPTTSNLWDRYGFNIQNQLHRHPPSSVDVGENVDNSRPWSLWKCSRTWWTALPTATGSHEYQKQRSAEGGSAIDARSSEVGWAIAIFRRLQAIDTWNVWGSTAVASREESTRHMEATISIKWYGTQKLDLFSSATDKCEPSSSSFEWRTEGSTKPISAYKFNSEAT